MLLLNGEQFEINKGDCIEHIATMPAACVDFSIFSPPFPTLYAYTDLDSDVGNCDELTSVGKIHLGFFYSQFARILKPGRVAIVHVAQIPKLKRCDEIGLHDFRGMNIRLAERAGLVFDYDWLVRKNPQSQAIRTRSHELQFAGLEKDRANCRGAIGDYLLKFRAPGLNTVPVDSAEVTRNQWIECAEACWADINETRTLNVRGTKGDKDTRHICPLQLDVIERCIKLFTNPGEIVFSPFAGIGSEGFAAVKLGRRFYGCELKDEYYVAAVKNISHALDERGQEQKELLFASA